MTPREELESIEGAEIHSLVQRADGTLLGVVRLTRALPTTHAKLVQQGWTIARTTEDAPAVANALGRTTVPADVLLVRRETDDQLLDSIR